MARILQPFIVLVESDGANPYAGLILWDNTLYGTTYEGSSSNCGTVFKINTDGKKTNPLQF